MLDNNSTRKNWIFEGASWVCITAAIVLPVTCWLLLPHARIANNEESISVAHRVSRLMYVEGGIVSIGVFSFFGLKNWKPRGMLLRSILGIVAAGVGAYLFGAWAFALSFWR